MTETVPKGLATKLVKVMMSVSRVKKGGHNSFQNYDYVTEADILEALRGSLQENNVFIFSSVEGSHKEGDLSTVKVRNTLVDADTGESFSVFSIGTGIDKGDKAVYKALTGASKYFFLKNFLLPTGDDPEATEEGKSTGAKTTAVASAPLKAVASDTTEVKKPASFRSPKKVVAASTDDF